MMKIALFIICMFGNVTINFAQIASTTASISNGGIPTQNFIQLSFTPNITDSPSDRFTIIEGNVKSLILSLSSIEPGIDLNTELKSIRVVSSDEDLVVPLNQTFSIQDSPEIFSDLENISIPMRGIFLGKPVVTISLIDKNDSLVPIRVVNSGVLDDEDSEPVTSVYYPVAVVRSATDQKLSNIFTVFIGLITFINTFIMGLQLDWNIIKGVVKKPIAPVIGFVCQYGMMPLIAASWAFLILAGQPNLQFGYFSVGCSPGGGPSNMFTLLLGGNLNLSVTMTFFSNIAALAMMPAWLFSMGTVFYGGKLIIPFGNILISLGLMICPVFLGILAKHFRPDWGKKTEKLVKVSSLVIIVLVMPFGVYANLFIFQQISKTSVLCGLLLPYSGFLVSYLVGWMFQQGFRNSITIAIETGIQNAAIATVLINFSLPKPESDMSLVMPISVLILTPLPLIFVLILKYIYERFTGKTLIPAEKAEEEGSQDPDQGRGSKLGASKDEKPTKEQIGHPTAISGKEKSVEMDDTIQSAYNMRPLTPVTTVTATQTSGSYDNKGVSMEDEENVGLGETVI